MDANVLNKFKVFYSKNDLIFLEGDEALSLFYILSGKVVLSKRLDGTKRILAVLGAGDVFGELALTPQAVRITNARATEDTFVIKLEDKIVYELMIQNSDFMMAVIKAMGQRIVSTNSLSPQNTNEFDPIFKAYMEKFLRKKYGYGHIDPQKLSFFTDELYRFISSIEEINKDNLLSILEELEENNIIEKMGEVILIKELKYFLP